MPRQITTPVYLFEELSDKAKERARDWFRQAGANDDFEFVYSDAYRYRTPAEREAAVVKGFESRRASLKLKAETKGKRTAENLLTVGDILNTCWGYDQTNREFFEVIEVSGKHVIIREIAQAREDTGHMTGRCAPQSGEFIGKPMRKLVQWGTSVTIDDVCTARKWNTSTVAGVPVGPALSWSNYA